MRDESFNLNLDPDPTLPVYLRVARAVARAIETGILRPGDPLPGSRALAQHFHVNRNTILLSLNQLEAQAWVEIQPNRGTFVATRPREGYAARWEERLVSAVPDLTPTPFQGVSSLEDSVHLDQGGGWDLREGIPDARLVPMAELGRNYRKALERKEGEALTSQDPKGHPDLRRAMASWLARRRGLPLGPECVVTTTGLRMSLELLTRALLRDSDLVAVEVPGPPEVRWLLEHQGLAWVGIPVDAGGLDVEVLARHLEAGLPIRLLLVGAACQVPTGTCLAPERRQALLDLVKRHRFVIAEDEGGAEWYRDERPPLPLAHFDRTGKVVHLGSFAHWLAPGLHSGFLYARGAVADRLASLKKRGHLNTDQVLESALASLVASDTLQVHLRATRKLIAARLQAAADTIASWPGFQVEPRWGGLGLWVKVPAEVEGLPWQKACARQGIHFRLGVDFGAPSLNNNHCFLGLAHISEDEQKKALEIMHSCLKPE